MDIIKDWPNIRLHFRSVFKSSFHVAIASIQEDQTPTVTPIGSLFLNEDHTGFYFEKYPSKLPQQAINYPNICILGVNSSRWFWLFSLFKGKFKTYPAIKLYGQLGIKRKATEAEINRLLRRMRLAKGLKGYEYLWKNMDYVRELKFSKAEKINLAAMTADLA